MKNKLKDTLVIAIKRNARKKIKFEYTIYSLNASDEELTGIVGCGEAESFEECLKYAIESRDHLVPKG
jgi:hypothetical protein